MLVLAMEFSRGVLRRLEAGSGWEAVQDGTTEMLRAQTRTNAS